MSEATWGRPDRRTLLRASAAGAVGLPHISRALTGLNTAGRAQVAAQAASAGVDPVTAATLEAFADTIVPGEKRYAGDSVIAGAAPGPSAVVCGFLDALAMPVVGAVQDLPAIASVVNQEAQKYAQNAGYPLDRQLPAFVGLPFAMRTGLAGQMLTAGGNPQLYSLLLASIASWAFDTAASMSTATAVSSGHPGLAWLGFPQPHPDGLWRFPHNSYKRVLAELSPRTSPDGSPS